MYLPNFIREITLHVQTAILKIISNFFPLLDNLAFLPLFYLSFRKDMWIYWNAVRTICAPKRRSYNKRETQILFFLIMKSKEWMAQEVSMYNIGISLRPRAPLILFTLH